MGTLVERTTLFVALVRLDDAKAATVANAFATILNRVDSQLRRSMTYDQGTEMAQHKALTEQTSRKIPTACCASTCPKAATWSGIRKATEYGHDCMQLPFPSDAAPLGTTPSEDCLVMDVWVPEHHSGKLPVMVWIYGGGWVNGGSSPAVYDGSQFARKGIVFVSFNYRLGRFSFFAFPKLSKESKEGLLGNYGYMDQIAALKWVQRNAAAFGGDSHNVTVFGESAGLPFTR